mmetsp:Transcript_11311/g.26894  ORF Transcript_11311/g.26894 Transcript_11311/m.26894 type:complete len:401 (-) Transcript_11311:321-1523(-)|eukprot:CAMPEP_0113473372 /NCGR_PEP_ID=MMETSP0014_2-20120614/18011_1 /TAXON_ID=2857 /ORGANISM="Nitzschia sp." /LENGTH=400 /DNA_ID=CAMNT_0000366139 /DNA_START=128 /DNA_END=1333 /DNA_ORIENTATION=- /assembly_acc=CAM_ASM_000159
MTTSEQGGSAGDAVVGVGISTTPLLQQRRGGRGQQQQEQQQQQGQQQQRQNRRTQQHRESFEHDDPPDAVETELSNFRTWFNRQKRHAIPVAFLSSLSCIVLVIIWIHELGGLSWKTTTSSSQHVFNWHPLLMVVAFAFMTVATLSFRLTLIQQTAPSDNNNDSNGYGIETAGGPDGAPTTTTTTTTTASSSSSSSSHWTRAERKTLHAMSWSVALLSMSIGLIAVFRSHNGPPTYIANLYSFHSWVGITVFGLYVLQFLAAFFAFGGASSTGLFIRRICRIRPSSSSSSSSPSAAPSSSSISSSFKTKLLIVHYYAGPTIYVGVMVTILLGIQEKEGFISCAYPVTTGPDKFPPSHFNEIPLACRQSHLLGILILVTGSCTIFALSSSPSSSSSTGGRQ